MTRRTRNLPGLLAAAVAIAALAGCDAEPEAADDLELDQPIPEQPATTAGQDTAGQSAQTYEARLEERNGSGVSGTATVSMEGDELQVSITATGLDADTRIPQHIHVNESCDNAGGILLNLDDGLTAAGEGQPNGDAYPQSDADGNLTYEASRSMAGMQADTLDLGNRVVNLHGSDMQPISCGALDSATGR